MPRNGSGTYTRTDGTRTGAQVWQDATVAGVLVNSPDADTHDQDIANALTNSVAADGQTPMTGDLDLGGNSPVSMGSGTLASDGAPLSQVQGAAYAFATDVGAVNAYAILPQPGITSLVTGTVMRWTPGATNTAASTLDVSGLGATAITSMDGEPLVGGEVVAGRVNVTLYDGTQWLLLGVQSTMTLVDADAGSGFGPTIALKRVSPSPAVSDDMGAVLFYGQNDAAGETLYGYVTTQIQDDTAGSEQGTLQFTIADGSGGEVSRMFVTSSEVQIADADTGAGAGPALTLRRASASPADNDLGGYLSNAMNNVAATRTEFGRIQGKALDVTAGTELGEWLFETMVSGSLTELMAVGVRTAGGAGVNITRSGAPGLRVDRQTNDGELVQFAQNGTKEGQIVVTGGTVTYEGFVGAHWSQWGERLVPQYPLPQGTLLSTVDEHYERADGSAKPNYVKCRVTADRACRRIYGTYSHTQQAEKDEAGKVIEAERVVLHSVGAGMARVLGPVKGGDLLMASDTPGVAIAQDDDVIRSYTLGKANMGYDGTDEALLPVTLMSG